MPKTEIVAKGRKRAGHQNGIVVVSRLQFCTHCNSETYWVILGPFVICRECEKIGCNVSEYLTS